MGAVTTKRLPKPRPEPRRGGRTDSRTDGRSGRLRIKVSCLCGRSRSVPFGSVWSCPDCGARWDTGQVPASEYRDIEAALARIKRGSLGGLGVIGLLTLVLVFVIGPGVLLDVPLVLAIYYFWYVPRYRKQLRRLYQRLPHWQLTPE